MKKFHGNIKCDCGHTQKDHYLGEGFCHHSEHERPGECGCTWFWPNVNYVLRKLKEKRQRAREKRMNKKKQAKHVHVRNK